MFARLFYIAAGFAVGYMLDSLRQQNQGSETEVSDIPVIDLTDVANVTESVNGSAKVVQSTSAEPASAPEADVHDSPAFLKQINGIGPTYAKRIFAAGINSLQLLASKTPAELMEISKVRSQEKAQDWIDQAKNLAA